MLEKINQEIKHSPEGCLKIQQKKGKIYYYHQYKDNTTEKMTNLYKNISQSFFMLYNDL